MTLLSPERTDRTSADEPDHLICGECFPQYVPGRIVRGLCGSPTPDCPECGTCESLNACVGGCMGNNPCSMCLLMRDGIGCHIHPG